MHPSARQVSEAYYITHVLAHENSFYHNFGTGNENCLLCHWVAKLVLLSQTMPSKTQTNHDLLTHILLH